MLKKLLVSALCLCACATVMQALSEKDRKDYLDWMLRSLPESAEFTQWQARTGELPPDFDALPSCNALPDPLRFFDGTPVGPAAADWERRRAEIKELFQQYVLGTFPPKPVIGKVEVTEETRGEGYFSRSVTLFFGPGNQASVRVSLTVPTGMPGDKYPVLLSPSLGGWGNQLLRRGYISAGYAGSDFMDDSASLEALYPDYDFAKLPRRAWTASIVLDYLATLPEVDMDRVAIFGYSRDGKMALIAGAFDERFKAVLAGSTGVGGVVPWRYSGERGGGEGIESTTRMFPDWFVPRLRFFSGREDRLPVDANLFLALVAPRAILMEWGLNDEVANGWAMEQAYASALPVYQRLGAPDRMALMHVPGFHGSNDQEAMIDFLDIQFGRSARKWHYDFLYTWDQASWKKHEGAAVDPRSFPVRNAKAPLARNLKDWEGKVGTIRQAIAALLGETPVEMPSTGRGGFGFFGFGRGGQRPGPVELAKGGAPNPGQLAPDVPTWVVARNSVEFGWVAPGKDEMASKRISFGDGLTGDLYYPAAAPAEKKLPVVIWLHGFNYPLGYMWVYRRDPHPIIALTQAGYAVLCFDQSGFGTRYGEYAGFYDRYPQWSRLGRMVKDLRGAVDALQTEERVDPANITVLGYTLGGMVGLYGAAADERIRNVVSVCGFTPMRTDKASNHTTGLSRYGSVAAIAPRIECFAGQEERLPYDFDELIALIAPRGVLVVQNTMDRDADTEAVRAAVERARTVYQWKGAGAQLTLQSPEDYARFNAAEQEAVVAWIQAHTE